MANYQIWYNFIMKDKLEVAFYQEPNGNEPVRVWLKNQDKETRLIIGNEKK